MTGRFSAHLRGDRFNGKINRDQSELLAIGLPLLTIVIGSLNPMLPIISFGPVVPPLGFMLLIGWRLVRPGLLPLWIGLPLGIIDDMFSGQPFGNAVLLWSVTMLAIEAVEVRFPWRGFWQDWITASAMLAAYLIIGALLSGAGINISRIGLIFPQLLLSVLLFPIIARVIAVFDRIRLLRIKVIE